MNTQQIKFDERGYICAIAQDAESGEVLMQAYMNAEALEKTFETGYAHYYSRSRGCLWKKGETSGHLQKVVGAYFDCDCDCLLLKVEQTGAACHTGARSCFFRTELSAPAGISFFGELERTVKERHEHPVEGSYTSYLFEKGVDKIAKKVGEEAVEAVIAAKNEGAEELISESADLLYHLLVLLEAKGTSLSAVCKELEKRHS